MGRYNLVDTRSASSTVEMRLVRVSKGRAQCHRGRRDGQFPGDEALTLGLERLDCRYGRDGEEEDECDEC